MSHSAATLDEFVRASTRLRPVPYVPEVRLHLADDAFGLWERTEHRAEQQTGRAGRAELPPPFWAFAWPGGQALARYLLDHRAEVSGLTVLDLGSGSGLTAIAAALAGADRVLASDVDPIAVAAIGLNAQANEVQLRITGDVLDGDGDGEGADLILAGDIWYERRLAQRALGMLRRAAARGARVLAGDVGRAFLPRACMRELACYQVPVVADLEDAAVKRAMVLELPAESAQQCGPGGVIVA